MEQPRCSNPDHSDRAATTYCAECGKYYCTECEATLHNKVFADHAEFVTHDVAAAAGGACPFTGRCDMHSGSPLDFFCKDHQCLCCAQCMLEGGGHSSCHVKPLSEADAQAVARRLPRTTAKLEALVQRAQRFSERGLQHHQQQQSLEQSVSAARSKIRAAFSELRAAIDAREQELLAAADRALSDHSVAGKCYVGVLARAAAALEHARQVEHSAVRPKEAVYRASEARVAAKELEEALEGAVDALCKSATVTVAFDEGLMRKTAEAFGSLKVDLASSTPRVAVEEVLADKIAVSWDPVPFDAVYRVRMAAGAESDGSRSSHLADLYKGKATICVVGGLKPGTPYTFWVQTKVYGCWGRWSSPTVVRTALPPGPPTVVGKAISSNQIYLQWDKIPNASGYCLEMLQGGTRSRAVTTVDDIISGNSDDTDNDNDNDGNNKSIHKKRTNNNNNNNNNSSNSDDDDDGNFNGNDNGNNNDGGSGDDGDDDDDGDYVVIYNGPKASFIKDVLCPNTEYTFRVRAEYKDAVSSAWSSKATVAVTDNWDCAWKECPGSVRQKKKIYSLHPGNPRIATKLKNGHELLDKQKYSTVLGTKSLPSRRTTAWGVRVLRSKGNNGGYIFVGVAPYDIDQGANANFAKCGWYFYCFDSRLYSGPPHNYRRRMYGPRKKFGEYVGTGDTVGVTMDTVKGELSFVLRSVDYGVAYKGIPLDKPLVPCALLYFKKDSVELIA